MSTKQTVQVSHDPSPLPPPPPLRAPPFSFHTSESLSHFAELMCFISAFRVCPMLARCDCNTILKSNSLPERSSQQTTSIAKFWQWKSGSKAQPLASMPGEVVLQISSHLRLPSARQKAVARQAGPSRCTRAKIVPFTFRMSKLIFNSRCRCCSQTGSVLIISKTFERRWLCQHEVKAKITRQVSGHQDMLNLHVTRHNPKTKHNPSALCSRENLVGLPGGQPVLPLFGNHSKGFW